MRAMSNDKPFSTRGCANGFTGSQSTGTLTGSAVPLLGETPRPDCLTAKIATPSPRSVYAFLFIFTTGLLTPGMMRSAIAQVTSDGTTNTIVNPSGNNFNILNGIDKGNNLFHSFSNLSVPTGAWATFDLINTPNITTIFSRVTGGNVSHIDGLIQANGSANLFLLNPPHTAKHKQYKPKYQHPQKFSSKLLPGIVTLREKLS